jgi:hypothetical protein
MRIFYPKNEYFSTIFFFSFGTKSAAIGCSVLLTFCLLRIIIAVDQLTQGKTELAFEQI